MGLLLHISQGVDVFNLIFTEKETQKYKERVRSEASTGIPAG